MAKPITTTIPCPPGYQVNTGSLPTKAKGKRVDVVLRKGSMPTPAGAGMPPGWAADGKQPCRWTLIGDDHDILFYKVL